MAHFGRARLQTLDRGAPVSAWTVAREVGHSSTDMIEDVYGHLGQVRHRAKVVEYRAEQHKATLKDRLARLTGRGSNKPAGQVSQVVAGL